MSVIWVYYGCGPFGPKKSGDRMAKKKAPANGEVAAGRKSITTLKGSPEWAEWLGGLSTHFRTSVTGVIDRALAEWAEANGYPIKPPPR